LTLRLRNEIT